jgi:hypothetical protein
MDLAPGHEWPGYDAKKPGEPGSRSSSSLLQEAFRFPRSPGIHARMPPGQPEEVAPCFVFLDSDGAA